LKHDDRIGRRLFFAQLLYHIWGTSPFTFHGCEDGSQKTKAALASKVMSELFKPLTRNLLQIFVAVYAAGTLLQSKNCFLRIKPFLSAMFCKSACKPIKVVKYRLRIV